MVMGRIVVALGVLAPPEVAQFRKSREGEK